jgi:hypothetical protein
MVVETLMLAAAMALAEPPRLVPKVECRIEPVAVAVVEPTPHQGGLSGALVHYLVPTCIHPVREGWSVNIQVTWPIQRIAPAK